jgi:RNA polymerase sigma factor (sigma-70 family)
MSIASTTLIEISPRSADSTPITWLTERLRARDELVHTRVLRELLPCVRRWMFRLLGPSGDLDDAVQEALSEIASALHRFEGRSSLRTLAQTIATRTAYRFYGRRARAAETEAYEVEPACDGDTPEERAAARQLVDRLYGHLAALPPARRTAIVLCVIEGLSPTEAAAIEGCTALAMRGRLFHARAELERALMRDPGFAALRGGAR